MTQETSPITLWLVDDDETFRETLSDGLGLHKELRLTSFGSCDEALKALDTHATRPQVVLLDYSLPGISGFRGICEIKVRSPETRIIMLTVHNERNIIEGSIKEGAFGFLQKATGLDETIAAIQDAVSGRRHIDATSLTILLDGMFRSGQAKIVDPLSTRQKEILALFSAGMNRGQVATRLGVSVGTVTTQVSRLFAKLDVHKMNAAVKRALEDGLI